MAVNQTDLSSPSFLGTATVSIDAANVTANSTSKQTFTVTGLRPAHIVFAQPTANLTTGLYVIQTYCAANDTLTIVFQNTTGSDINNAAALFKIATK
jgi:hypothetical protein